MCGVRSAARRARYLPRSGVASSLLLSILAATALAADRPDAIHETVAEYFRPFQHDLATLAPDGRRLAMTEHVPGKPPAITIVNLDDRSTRTYAVDRNAEHVVQQLQWVSPMRLVFSTRGRAVGTLELESGEIKALLVGKNLDAFQPDPVVGTRHRSAVVTPEMAMDSSRLGAVTLDDRRSITVREALAQARVTGDLFGSDSKRDAGRALRPFLLGAKPGSANTILVELRTDGDLFAYRRQERRQVTVPGGVYIDDRSGGIPMIAADVGLLDARRGEYAVYDIDFRLPPLVVLELDTVTGRTREVAMEDDWRRVWLDQQGRLRLALEQSEKRFRYLYRAADAKKWVPLDTLVKTATPLGFNVGADNVLGPRSVPLGFDVNGQILFIATNVGRDTFAVRALDLTNGRLQNDFEVGHDRFDLIEPTALTSGDVLRFDPHTRSLAGVSVSTARRDTTWFDPGMKALQDKLNQQLAPQRCELREWTADRTRFLVEVWGPSAPGGFIVADAATGKMIRCGERAPWLTEAKRNPTHEFDFSEHGRRLAGSLTVPRTPRLSPPPVLVYFHDGPWFCDSPLFNRGAQALAALGFAVLQVNYRGSSGLGRTHLTATEGSLDRAVLKDIQALLSRFSSGKHAVNPKLVATLGNGMGGYLAVRMAQLAPETFRCAVAINAPGDLEAWRTHPGTAPTILADLQKQVFGTDREALRAQSAVAAGATTKAPVLVVHGTENAYVPIALGLELYGALTKGSDQTAFLALPGEGHGGWSEKTTAKLFAELGRFFNATIYNYGVEVRKPEVVR